MDVKRAVRDTYGKIARQGSCCASPVPRAAAESVGYRSEELEAAPAGSNLGLGCGNPTAIADLRAGETVLDLGSGAGFDCFLAARAVGSTGAVIGVDMTPEMVEKARSHAARAGQANVDFRLGEIEHLPAADQSVDVVISNCVINLVPDKAQAFREAYRVLKPGGRLHLSDIVLTREAPESLRGDLDAYCACVAGALTHEAYLSTIEAAGFVGLYVTSERDATELLAGSCCAPDVNGDVAAKASCCGPKREDAPTDCCSPQGQADDLRGLALSITLSARRPEYASQFIWKGRTRAMATVKGTIKAGVCGFITEVTASSPDSQHVSFEVQSTCDNITAMASQLPEVDAYAELGAGFDGALHQVVRGSLRGCCSGCVVPAGLFKAMQIAASTALPQTATMTFERISD